MNSLQPLLDYVIRESVRVFAVGSRFHCGHCRIMWSESQSVSVALLWILQFRCGHCWIMLPVMWPAVLHGFFAVLSDSAILLQPLPDYMTSHVILKCNFGLAGLSTILLQPLLDYMTSHVILTCNFGLAGLSMISLQPLLDYMTSHVILTCNFGLSMISLQPLPDYVCYLFVLLRCCSEWVVSAPNPCFPSTSWPV